MGWIGTATTGLAVGLALPVGVLVAECVAGLLPSRRLPTGRSAARNEPPGRDGPEPLPTRPRAAIVVPAHDEAAILGETLRELKGELGPDDRIFVVADNCSDRTAEVARAAGVEVLERRDPEHRGKGYAISFALDSLANDPPDVVVIFDADCRANAGTVGRIVELAARTGRPVQAEYILEPPPDPSLRTRVSAFAFIVRNSVRARGLSRLSGTCQLVGSGMAFPWDVIVGASALGGHLVEDLALGFDCALRGHAPLLCSDARVTSELPGNDEAALTQRRRWETGHLSMVDAAWSLVLAGAVRRDPALLGLGLDLAVPPLSLLALGLGVGSVSSAAACLTGHWPAAAGLALESAAASAVLGMTWLIVGRDVLPPRDLLGIPAYVAWKLPVYGKFALRGKETRWVRTERKAS